MRRLAAVVLLLVCAGCAGTSSLFSGPTPDPATQMPALEARIAELVRAQRHAIDPKAKELVLDAELASVARQHSTDMAARNAFADPNGDPHISATRLMAADAKFQGLLGENVAAQRFAKGKAIDIEQFAQRFIATWLASPSHKENLAFADYERTGVGAAASGDTIFVTQLFATDVGGTPTAAKAPEVKSFTSANAAKAEAAPSGPGLRGAMGAP